MTAVALTYTRNAAKTLGFDKYGSPIADRVDGGAAPAQGVVGADFTSTAPAGTSEEVVARLSITAGDLNRIGAILEGLAWAVHAANTDACVMSIRIGAAGITAAQGTVVATVASAVSGDKVVAQFKMYVTSTSAQVALGQGFGGALVVVNTSNLSLSLDLSAAVDVIVTCTNAVAASLPYKGSIFRIL